MAKDVRKLLLQIKESYEPSVFEDFKKAKGLFSDFFPENKMEIEILTLALKEGAAKEIKDKFIPYILIRGRVANKLIVDHGIAEIHAFWAVDSIALTLGSITADEIDLLTSNPEAHKLKTEYEEFNAYPPEHKNCYTSGSLAFFNNDYSGAIAAISSLIEISPFNCDLLFKRALSYFKLCAFEQCVDDFDKILKINPDYTVAYYYRALSNYNLLKLKDALADSNLLVSVDNNNFEYLFLRSTINIELNKLKDAENDLLIITGSGSKNEKYFYKLAEVYEKTGRLEKAVSAYTELLDINENNPDHYYKRASLNKKLSKFEPAICDIKRALELFCEYDEYYLMLGELLIASGNPEEAKIYLDRASSDAAIN